MWAIQLVGIEITRFKQLSPSTNALGDESIETLPTYKADCVRFGSKYQSLSSWSSQLDQCNAEDEATVVR